MANKREPLGPDRFYHIYNHAVGNEDLFREDENYQYFLQKYAEYINPVAETYVYCLMPNHFHFLIRMKNEKDLMEFYLDKYPKFKKAKQNQPDPAGFQNQPDPVGFQNQPDPAGFQNPPGGVLNLLITNL